MTVDKIKPINNPLTIIAIFAALSEIASTVAVTLIAPELQSRFLWFVMFFPAGIVLLFFLILFFKNSVLYAPSDFKDEKNFLIALGKTVSANLEEISQQLETAKKQILDDVVKEIGAAGEIEREKLKQAVDQRLNPVQTNVEKMELTWRNISNRDYLMLDKIDWNADMNTIVGVLYSHYWQYDRSKKIPTKELRRIVSTIPPLEYSDAMKKLVNESYITITNGDISITPKIEGMIKTWPDVLSESEKEEKEKGYE
jgi:hypothetical protein